MVRSAWPEGHCGDCGKTALPTAENRYRLCGKVVLTGDRQDHHRIEARGHDRPHAAGRIIGIEVKADAAARRDAAKHLAWLRDQIGDRFVKGMVLHTGPCICDLDDRDLAVPISTLWAWSDQHKPASGFGASAWHSNNYNHLGCRADGAGAAAGAVRGAAVHGSTPHADVERGASGGPRAARHPEGPGLEPTGWRWILRATRACPKAAKPWPSGLFLVGGQGSGAMPSGQESQSTRVQTSSETQFQTARTTCRLPGTSACAFHRRRKSTTRIRSHHRRALPRAGWRTTTGS